MACPHLDVRRRPLVGGVRSSGESRSGGPFHPGGRGRGEDRTGELLEPSLMPREGALARWDVLWARTQGLAVEKRQAPVKETTWPGEHRRPRGREGTQPGRSSCVRNAVTPSRSGAPSGVSGKPTARGAQLLGGNRMTEKRMPAAERRRETGTARLALRRSSRITGRIRDVVPGRESVLTRSGEPVKRRRR